MKNVENIYLESQKKLQAVRTDVVKKVYFMGIKGVGMTALAVIAKQAGFSVGGCDVDQEFITDRPLQQERITVDRGFDPTLFVKFIEGSMPSEVLLIITGAHDGFANPVAQCAVAKGVQVITQGQAVGIFMDGRIFGRSELIGISVAGSHGKTSITAMLATMLDDAGESPSYVIGTGEINPLGVPGHYGKGDVFVAEADEYASDIHFDLIPKLFYQRPKYAIINNIDFDHPDFYPAIEDVQRVFDIFINNIALNGIVIVNGDDKRIKDIIDRLSKNQVLTYGINAENDITLSHFIQKQTESGFEVAYHRKSFGEFSLQVPGMHNALNSLAVIGVGLQLGLSYEQIKHGLHIFKGAKRRSEFIGIMENGAIVIDDYAHHPKEIMTTLNSLKTAYHDKKIVCIFQPHTYSRTESLLTDFADSSLSADEIILLPVFSSARESSITDTVSARLEQAIRSSGKDVHFIKNAADVVQYVTQNYSSTQYIILTMGAGDVYKIALQLTGKQL